MANYDEPVIIVEGRTDKLQLEKVLTEPVEILCTHGTLGIEEMDNLIETHQLDERYVYLLTDQDHSGLTLRQQLTAEIPHATQLYVREEFREVATTPTEVLAAVLAAAHFDVHPVYRQFKL